MRKTKRVAIDSTSSNGDIAIRPWSGHILDCNITHPGGMLVGALTACAAERGHLLKDVAEELDVTYGYLSQLRSDTRSVLRIGDDFARDCAKYLGISVARVWSLSGKLEARDLYAPQASFESEVVNAVEFIGRDAAWGHQLTPELRRANPESQHMLVKLYEAATGKTLLPRDAAAAPER